MTDAALEPRRVPLVDADVRGVHVRIYAWVVERDEEDEPGG